MKILVACEYSGRVRRALRARGHRAVSCDILPSLDDSPFHIQTDISRLLSLEWELVIAFPPCTHLAASGAKHWAAKREDGRQQQGIDFFMQFTRLTCPWAIENPVGIMSSVYRKPDQIIQPWMFGDEARKTTCLWLHRLPKLVPTNIVGEGELRQLPDGRMMPGWYTTKGPHRSVTFQGIADAMASQWA